MHVLDPTTLRSLFVNATRKELSDITLPPSFETIDWDRLDYFGWRDARMARRAYVVLPKDDGAVGVLLRQADASPRSRAQCSWCRDVRLPNDVVFYSARRAGPAGRRGDTIGTFMCQEFECSANVRKAPPPAYLGFDVEAARDAAIRALQASAAGFARSVLEP